MLEALVRQFLRKNPEILGTFEFIDNDLMVTLWRQEDFKPTRILKRVRLTPKQQGVLVDKILNEFFK